jgi:DNA primase
MISESTIESIRSIHLEDVLSKYIHFKNHEACCPIHGEKTPSFKISKKTNLYKCFGCGESGDAIKFVQWHDKLTFAEAIERIAKDHNIAVEYIDNGETPEERKAKMDKVEVAKQILAFCHEYYRKALRESDAIKAILLERGFDDDKIEEWQLGYAPEGWKNVTKSIIEKGWFDVAVEIGILKTKEGNNYDAYRNRIMVPIHDRTGQLIGFGARAIGDDKPKYLNPNENLLYSKANLLFGLDRAEKAIKEHDRVILVEGYFDVMSMHNAGVEYVVAPCGTACDDKQLKLIKRYTPNITIMYDGDKAGEDAKVKRVKQCLALGFNTMVVSLTGQDPDDLAQTYSHEQKVL